MESYTRFKITGIIHQQKKNTRKELPFSNAEYAENAERYGARNSAELKLRETHVQKAKRKPVITPTSHVITNRRFLRIGRIKKAVDSSFRNSS